MVSPEIAERIIQRTIEIQQIPSPTFFEEKRAKFIWEKFEEEGLEDVTMDDVWNVYARLPGENREPNLVVSAHLDTVFPLDTDLTIVKEPGRVVGPGIGDNSVGIAGLFGLLWSLKENRIQLPGDLWLVANSREEGLGDLQGMKKVIDRFGKSPLAYIVLEGMVFGRIYHQGLGVRRYRIICHTPGGHSWVDYGTPSAIHELSSLAIRIVNQKLPVTPRTTMNIGKFNGGISVNSIASEAVLELDLRSESSLELKKIATEVETMVTKSARMGVDISFEVIGDRKPGELALEHPLVLLAIEVLKQQGVTPELILGSTDANVPLSRGIPAICIGLTNGGNGHTSHEFIFTDPINDGVSQVVEVARGAFEVIDNSKD
jgi:tripeptide aminopeptidase